ncbi:MAG: hypothetical protein ACYTBJ_00205 [Planctomycetota bacterium]|jgi:hypothetical protein
MRMLDLRSGDEFIREGILSDRPFMVGRYGLTEGMVCWWHGILGRKLGKSIKHRLSWGVGLYPITDDMIDAFIVQQRSGALMCDATVRWGTWGGEMALLKQSCGANTIIIPPEALNSFLFLDDPWTAALKGLRVLVVHPFADTIIDQYDNHREEIWENPNILPKFKSLVMMQAPITHGGKGPDVIDSEDWLDTLDILQDMVGDPGEGYDVALIGCGGYGLPLAGYIRMLGGKAIHLGGGLQLLFGIRGRRWDNDDRITPFYNDHWVRPFKQETPEGYKKVEGGCYW